MADRHTRIINMMDASANVDLDNEFDDDPRWQGLGKELRNTKSKSFHECKVDEYGTKEYFNEKGQYHRTDGPAIDWPKGGIKEWHLNGLLHREGGPAAVLHDGIKWWSLNGELHRTDGPAIVWPRGGKKKWYFEGKEVEPMFHECEVNEYGTKKYYNEKGEFHHTHGPAIEWIDGDKEWWLNGKLHRTDGPAIEYASRGIKAWYRHEKLHRIDGPAIDWTSEGRKEWYFEGEEVEPMFHKCKDEDGVKEYFNEKGQLHHTHGPAVIKSNGTKKWYLNGELHRVGGPAYINTKGYKVWWFKGRRHRDDGPAIESNDTLRWFRHGESHRVGGPAIIWKGYSTRWLQNDKLHREDGPAVINDNGDITERFWFLHGKRHRKNGPAVELANGKKEWWVNGEQVKPPQKGIWTRGKNNRLKRYRECDDITYISRNKRVKKRMHVK